MKLNKLIPFGVISTIAFALPLSAHATQTLKPITSGGMYSQELQASTGTFVASSPAHATQVLKPVTSGATYSQELQASTGTLVTSPPSAHATQALKPVTSGATYSQELQASHPQITIAQAGERLAAVGTFVAAEKPTTGTARIVVENGQRYLILDSAFQTSDQGPDLHVVLDPSNKPSAQYQDPTQYINLGKLQKFAGEQRYPIPAAVDLSKFKSVGIWCRMANATFGYAPLQSPANAAR